MANEELRLSNISVRRDTRFEHLVDRLCKREVSSHGTLFQYIKDLMVFAALVGYANKKKVPINQGANTISITLETYSSDEKDSFIYLLALMENRDTTCLKNENLHEAIRIFEAYCNGGLQLIEQWFLEESSEPDVMNILLNKIHQQIIKNDEDGNTTSNDHIEVEF